ncbi:amino acid permease, partial [Ammoniphilus sp. 3BR4]|uniref:amino acid permease n=1 Tax=Ammoniphilus sp. 3BR4 TaxID=3158265 RepID=UPI003466BA70
SLTNRQIQMLAIGGVIGVGLFYGSATAVKLAGPGVLITFVLCGILAAIVMRALGEMTVEHPVAGSFSHYAGDLLGTRMGFLTAGMWWFYWVATVMSELAAIGKLVQYWFPTFPTWIPGLIGLILFALSNLLAVRVFGEVEYWFAVLKVFAVSVFMIFGALIILTGLFNDGQAVGLTNLWSNGGFLPYGWLGVLATISLIVQVYSGIETLAVEAGESHNPGT